MQQLFFKPSELLNQLKPQDMGMRYTSLRRMEVYGSVEVQSANEELCFVCIEGDVRYACEGEHGIASMRDMLYVPIQSTITFDGTKAVLMKFGALCDRETHFCHIRFADVDVDDRHKVYGKVENGTRRDVWNFIDEKFDSSRFLCGMCHGTDGGWTAWPPHEHALKREETYIYFNMGKSFGAQFVYNDLDNPYTVALIKDGDVVSIPRGYHPNTGCPCGGIFYAYVMVSLHAEDRNFMDLQTQKIYGDRLE